MKILIKWIIGFFAILIIIYFLISIFDNSNEEFSSNNNNVRIFKRTVNGEDEITHEVTKNIVRRRENLPNEGLPIRLFRRNYTKDNPIPPPIDEEVINAGNLGRIQRGNNLENVVPLQEIIGDDGYPPEVNPMEVKIYRSENMITKLNTGEFIRNKGENLETPVQEIEIPQMVQGISHNKMIEKLLNDDNKMEEVNTPHEVDENNPTEVIDNNPIEAAENNSMWIIKYDTMGILKNNPKKIIENNQKEVIENNLMENIEYNNQDNNNFMNDENVKVNSASPPLISETENYSLTNEEKDIPVVLKMEQKTLEVEIPIINESFENINTNKETLKRKRKNKKSEDSGNSSKKSKKGGNSESIISTSDVNQDVLNPIENSLQIDQLPSLQNEYNLDNNYQDLEKPNIGEIINTSELENTPLSENIINLNFENNKDMIVENSQVEKNINNTDIDQNLEELNIPPTPIEGLEIENNKSIFGVNQGEVEVNNIEDDMKQEIIPLTIQEENILNEMNIDNFLQNQTLQKEIEYLAKPIDEILVANPPKNIDTDDIVSISVSRRGSVEEALPKKVKKRNRKTKSTINF